MRDKLLGYGLFFVVPIIGVILIAWEAPLILGKIVAWALLWAGVLWVAMRIFGDGFD